MTIDELRDLLESRTGHTATHGNGPGFQAHCPAHTPDKSASLSVDPGDNGGIVIKCFVDCAPEDICATLGITLADLAPDNLPTRKSPPKRVQQRNSRPQTQAQPGAKALQPMSRQTATSQATPGAKALQQSVQQSEQIPGCTLAEYAAAKRLPLDFLQRLGLEDFIYFKRPAVRIPYYADDGRTILSLQYRVGLHKADDGPDNRFRFRSGDKAVPYGQWRLSQARSKGAITLVKGAIALVEGASDCQTFWFHDVAALGIPGADNWKDERDAPLLDGFDPIYVVIEPDAGGETVKKWLATSRIRDRVRLVSLGAETKDPSALHIAVDGDRDAFAAQWQAALDASVSWIELEHAEAEQRSSQAWADCETLANTPDILSAFAQTLAAAGVAGEKRVAKLLYLIVTSRMLDQPVSCVMKGPSSSGKSYLVERVLGYFPESAYYALSAMSEHALAYSEEPLAHRLLVIYEAAGLSDGFATYLLRSLLSEGHVRYETVEKMGDQLQARLIEREGPTGVILTTTQVKLHPENETRLLSIPTTDSQEQTAAIFAALADESRSEPDMADWHALQTWLAGAQARVTIPYAEILAQKVKPLATRLRRDFGVLLRLIRAHAFLHQRSRERDEQDRIVATVDDYTVIRALVADLIAEGVGATIFATTRETVNGVAQFLALQPKQADNATPTATVSQLAKHLKLDKSTTSRRVSVALEAGYLVNAETRKHHASQLRIGESLPEEQEVLPSGETLMDSFLNRCSVADETEGVAVGDLVTPFSEETSASDNGMPFISEAVSEAVGSNGAIARFYCDYCGADRNFKDFGDGPRCNLCDAPLPARNGAKVIPLRAPTRDDVCRVCGERDRWSIDDRGIWACDTPDCGHVWDTTDALAQERSGV